jgi:hypothetical protein
MSSKSRALVGPQPRRTFFALASVLSALLSGCCRSCYRRFMYGMNERKRAHFSCHRPNPRPARRKGASVCQNRKSTFSKRHGVFVSSCNSPGPDHYAVGHRDGRNILAPRSKVQAPPPKRSPFQVRGRSLEPASPEHASKRATDGLSGTLNLFQILHISDQA